MKKILPVIFFFIIVSIFITNKFNKFDVSKLFVASITPNSSFWFFPWCFCASKNVISSGRLVMKPSAIPSTISGILK